MSNIPSALDCSLFVFSYRLPHKIWDCLLAVQVRAKLLGCLQKSISQWHTCFHCLSLVSDTHKIKNPVSKTNVSERLTAFCVNFLVFGEVETTMWLNSRNKCKGHGLIGEPEFLSILFGTVVPSPLTQRAAGIPGVQYPT